MNMDEHLTHALEQEAIALVKLSNAEQLALKKEARPTGSEATHGREATATSPVADASMELLEGTISMKSLLVTLKKRKMEHPGQETESTGSEHGSETTDEGENSKLPSFRTVFQPQPVHEVDHVAPSDVSIEPVPREFKCKYRTGKCQNARALKSCGDYHNLCNYHRLRANANQRKLDRKKKELRLQQQQLSASADVNCSSPPAYHKELLPTSSHAAAAALASLVAAQPHPHFDVLLQQEQRPFVASSVKMQETSSTNRHRSTATTNRVSQLKQQHACSY
ncbi:hypothetical protein PsorP6_001881 [Peronosclerospora sorghi]|uniref:Uncharacterized protein n=1 Tax=Peronosclerospora sorghi TaxID=230839 RepID=A0ACC0WUS2_9STRA|nr:hypothetical protein PsorP6_001881 [Peronosclerospora sorghi]